MSHNKCIRHLFYFQLKKKKNLHKRNDKTTKFRDKQCGKNVC